MRLFSMGTGLQFGLYRERICKADDLREEIQLVWHQIIQPFQNGAIHLL